MQLNMPVHQDRSSTGGDAAEIDEGPEEVDEDVHVDDDDDDFAYA